MTSATLRRSVLPFLAILLVAVLSGCTGSLSPDVDAAPHRESSKVGSTFAHPTKPMPPHGTTDRWLGSSLKMLRTCSDAGFTYDNHEGGTLEISVPPGDETYFAKVISRLDGGAVAGIIIRPGRTARVDVPVCDGRRMNYSLRYGAGTKWYGHDYLFGPKGAYSESEEVFEFENTTGWRVSLVLRVGGNLSSSGMDYAEFIR